MLRRLCSRSFSHLSTQLRSLELRAPLNLSKASMLIQHYKQYMPYTQTITQINRLIIQNNKPFYEEYLRALVEWKYFLPDVKGVCEKVVKKEEGEVLEEWEIDFLEMMVMVHGDWKGQADSQVEGEGKGKGVGEILIDCLQERVRNNTITIRDAKRVTTVERINPAKGRELSHQILNLLSQSNNPLQLSQLLISQTSHPNPTTPQKQLKHKIILKTSNLLANNLSTLIQQQTGEILGNLLSSITQSQQLSIFLPQLSKAKINSEEEFILFINLIQQYLMISSSVSWGNLTSSKKGGENVLAKVLGVLEIKREKFKESEKVEQALVENRYFLETILEEPKESHRGRTHQ